MMSEEHKTFEHEGRVLRQEVRIAAGREKVWEAWTSPAHLDQWFTTRSSGEPRPGAAYSWEFEGSDSPVRYQVVEAVAEKRLVLSSSSGGLLEILMLPEGKGSRVGIAQSGVPEGEAAESAWRMTLALLREYCENHFGRPKKSILIERATRAGHDRVRPFFTERSGLAKWLIASGRIAKPGSPYQWTLHGDLPLSGRVLSDSGFEVALFSTEIEAVVELKTYPRRGGEGNALAVRLTTWNPDQPSVPEYRRAFEGALERLCALLAGGG